MTSILLNRLSASITKHFHRTIADSFLTGTSSKYLEELYNAWLTDPKSVDPSWNSYFQSVTNDKISTKPHVKPSESPTSVIPDGSVDEHLGVLAVIRSYQARGHMKADIDPLQITNEERLQQLYKALGGTGIDVLKRYGLAEKMNQVYTLPATTFFGGTETKMKLSDIIERLNFAYCKHIGSEFVHINNFEERQFIKKSLETQGIMNMSAEQKLRTLKRLVRATEFERFLAIKWPSEKRFGLEGLEIVIPAVKQVIDKSCELGVDHFLMGVPHRGRLNVLANVCRKPLHQLFTRFDTAATDDNSSGDVKYHLGTTTQRVNRPTKKRIRLTVLANPSHLECVCPVVQGRTRAEQFFHGDHNGKRNVAILFHGDAAFSGQGVVYESLGLSDLPCYTTRGCIHIVLNNQIGFTTNPRFSRSSPYCTDVGRVANSPIFHVNADDPESVVHVCNIAAEWRATYSKDVIIDIVGYRRHGHNETDEPNFTQPLMYQKIRQMKPVVDKYAEQLIEEKIITHDKFKEIQKKYIQICEEEFKKAAEEKQLLNKDWLDTPWSGFFSGMNSLAAQATGVPEATLVHIGKKFSSPPPAELDFILHKGIDRILSQRMDLIEKREVDWCLTEAMAFGSLVKDGIHVRLSGQDSERGTFSHRHHVLHHQTIDKRTYNAMEHLFPDQATYTVCNSHLSEYGVLGFEMGFAQSSPKSLVIWEAQFGDFANTAQAIFDTFLSSGEAKWIRQNGLVVLLPHGFDGMGPEHSSARPERFLQMCDDDPDTVPKIDSYFPIKQLKNCNWIIANCSTPANFFHILRRQIALPFRKPLIVFTPKSLLRHPDCRSSFDDMLEHTEFQRLIPENGPATKHHTEVKKLLFCSGKVYYDVVKQIKEKQLQSKIAVGRIEQLFPFPYDLIKIECEKYPQAKICWLQEEHKNGGAYIYVNHRIRTLLNNSREVFYIGREVAAAVSTGFKTQHNKELKTLLDQATSL